MAAALLRNRFILLPAFSLYFDHPADLPQVRKSGRDRDDVFRELGKYYYQQIHDSGVIDDEVMEMYRHIGEYNDKIEELKRQLNES